MFALIIFMQVRIPEGIFFYVFYRFICFRVLVRMAAATPHRFVVLLNTFSGLGPFP